MSKHKDEIISENEFWYDGKHYEATTAGSVCCVAPGKLCAMYGRRCQDKIVCKLIPSCFQCNRQDGRSVRFREVQPKAATTTTAPAKRRVAKCKIVQWSLDSWSWSCEIAVAECAGKVFYTTRKDAIRGARRFCARIGHECEIITEDGK